MIGNEGSGLLGWADRNLGTNWQQRAQGLYNAESGTAEFFRGRDINIDLEKAKFDATIKAMGQIQATPGMENANALQRFNDTWMRYREQGMSYFNGGTAILSQGFDLSTRFMPPYMALSASIQLFLRHHQRRARTRFRHRQHIGKSLGGGQRARSGHSDAARI